MEKNKLVLPITILLGCIILGEFFYASQVIKLQDNRRVDEVRAVKADEQKEIDDANIDFDNRLKCQALFKELKQRWNNVVGIYYSKMENSCVIKYTEKGKIQESTMEDMQNN
jgi:hypothetical protein